MPTTLEQTSSNRGNVTVIARKNIPTTDPIAINNDAFDDTNDFLIDKHEIKDILFQVQNTGGNGLSYEVYGSIDPITVAPAFNLIEWELTNNGSGNIAGGTNIIFSSTLYYTWLLIRLKREVPSNDTNARIIMTSGFE